MLAGMRELNTESGQVDATDMRIGLVTTRWNTEVLLCWCRRAG